MVGYVAPDLILLVLSAGAGAATKARDAEKLVEVATATARAEEGIEKANLIGRSAKFLEDAERLPALRKIAWLDERTWELIKACPRLGNRLEKIAGWISDIRNVPGAKPFVECMAARMHLTDVEGNLFQLERAAAYARKGELAAVGRRFYVILASKGNPVRRTLAEADLELTDGTLVEVKFRTEPLKLDEIFHTQLQKYRRAVIEGQFNRIRVECSTAVSKVVRDRCRVLSEGLTSPIEILENVKSDPPG